MKNIISSAMMVIVLSFPFVTVEAAEYLGYWKLVNVEVQEVGRNPGDSEVVTCSQEGTCESKQSASYGGKPHVFRVLHSWSRPPSRLGPNESIPVDFQMKVLEVKDFGGGRASMDARRIGQGWAFMETPQGSYVVSSDQPVGTVIKRMDTMHKSLGPGKSGDKMSYEVHVKGGMVVVYKYNYEWTE
jgi:hypothetical protein